MKIRSGLATVVLLGSGLLGLGVSAPASALAVCAGTGTATFNESAVWYPALVPGGFGTDPAPGANSGTFVVDGACVSDAPGAGLSNLAGSFSFPNGAQCGRSAGGSGSLNNTGETFSIDTLGTVVLIAGEIIGVADATPQNGTSCRFDQGGTKNFTLVGAIAFGLGFGGECDGNFDVGCTNPNPPPARCLLWLGGMCIN